MTEQIMTAIVGHMVEIFFLVASVLLLYVIRTVKVKLTTEQQNLLSELIRASVLYVQQRFPDEMPEVKLEYAANRAVKLLEEKGLPINEESLLIQIESNLKELKLIFGDEWTSSETEP